MNKVYVIVSLKHSENSTVYQHRVRAQQFKEENQMIVVCILLALSFFFALVVEMKSNFFAHTRDEDHQNDKVKSLQ